MLITAAKTARYRKLADDLDAALGRGDDIGMDLLRDMLPDLSEAIEEINEALREADALLFEGLRDEAVGLHDAGLAPVAIRLHLEDKPQWPMAAMFFDTEGIVPPPRIDFESLTSLNTAFAELDELRKPLDKYRRLALERAPLTAKLSLLRKLRQRDSLKPVWGEQLGMHEEVRVFELSDAVKRAFSSRDPEQIASLHKELSNPGWSIPIPTQLKRDTDGGSVWRNLRRTINDLEPLVAKIVASYSDNAANREGLSVRAENLRRWRQQWLDGESRCREWLFSIPQYPAISSVVHHETFGPRLDGMRSAVAPAMQWLAMVDESDRNAHQFNQTCQELEYLVEHLPATADESAWLGKADKLATDIQKFAQYSPELKVSDYLQARIGRALADVRGRGGRRARRKIAMAVCAVLLAGVAIVAVSSWVSQRRAYTTALEYVDSLLPMAEKGEFVVRPEQLDVLAGKYSAESAFAALLERFDRSAKAEGQRRAEFDTLLTEHSLLIEKAENTLAERQEQPAQRMKEWPAAIFDASTKYSQARLKGGFPVNRHNEPSSGDTVSRPADGSYPPAVKQQWDAEETKLAEHSGRQISLTTKYENAAASEFKRRLRDIQDRIPDEGDVISEKVAKELRAALDALVEEAKQERSGSVKSSARVPYRTRELVEPIRLRLEKL